MGRSLLLNALPPFLIASGVWELVLRLVRVSSGSAGEHAEEGHGFIEGICIGCWRDSGWYRLKSLLILSRADKRTRAADSIYSP